MLISSTFKTENEKRTIVQFNTLFQICNTNAVYLFLFWEDKQKQWKTEKIKIQDDLFLFVSLAAWKEWITTLSLPNIWLNGWSLL